MFFSKRAYFSAQEDGKPENQLPLWNIFAICISWRS